MNYIYATIAILVLILVIAIISAQKKRNSTKTPKLDRRLFRRRR